MKTIPFQRELLFSWKSINWERSMNKDTISEKKINPLPPPSLLIYHITFFLIISEKYINPHIFLWDQNVLSIPAILLMTAMWPSFLSNIWGSTCLVRERTPRTFSSITSLSVSREVSSNKARWDRPALFTRMSI